MQRHDAHDDGTGEIDVLYDADLGGRVFGGAAEKIYAEAVETQAGALRGGRRLRQFGNFGGVCIITSHLQHREN